jgi:hypothetical protein
VHFSNIGSVEADGIQGSRRYSFTDKSPRQHTAMLYRVELEKQDRQKILSDIRLVRIDGDAFQLTLNGNPVNSQLQFSVNSTRSARAEITILNMAGNPVHKQTVQLPAGEQRIHVPVSTLPAGNYQLLVSTGTEKRAAGFIKQ